MTHTLSNHQVAVRVSTEPNRPDTAVAQALAKAAQKEKGKKS